MRIIHPLLLGVHPYSNIVGTKRPAVWVEDIFDYNAAAARMFVRSAAWLEGADSHHLPKINVPQYPG